jgi:hypothetical protein
MANIQTMDWLVELRAAEIMPAMSRGPEISLIVPATKV